MTPRKPRAKLPKLDQPVHIDLHAVYTFDAVKSKFGLTDRIIRMAVRNGELKVSKRGGRYWFPGAWLMEWFLAGEQKRKPVVAAVIPMVPEQPA